MLRLSSLLENVTSVGITGHIRPDGDCVGSTLGLYNYITENYPDISTDIYIGEFSESFNFLKNSDKIVHNYTGNTKQYDLFFVLDCGDLKRMGDADGLFNAAKKTVCIDHHICNASFADENYIVPDASSASELVFNTMEEDKISKETAECLYMGIAHDTGVFQYSCTSVGTMQAAGILMEKGINFSKIVDETYYQKTFHQNQILGRALLESITFLDGKAIVSVIKKDTMNLYEVTPKDLDGIVNQLRVTKGVECAIFMYEVASQQYKVSLRSNELVDVSKIAMHFGGGGHVRAAGCEMNGNMYDVINNLSAKIEEQIEAANV